MPTLSVSVPEDLRQKMSRMEEVNWSAVARKAFEQKVHDIEFVRGLAKKSKMTAKDVKEISDKINSSAANRFLEF
jgi:hypothetical protein